MSQGGSCKPAYILVMSRSIWGYCQWGLTNMLFSMSRFSWFASAPSSTQTTGQTVCRIKSLRCVLIEKQIRNLPRSQDPPSFASLWSNHCHVLVDWLGSFCGLEWTCLRKWISDVVPPALHQEYALRCLPVVGSMLRKVMCFSRSGCTPSMAFQRDSSASRKCGVDIMTGTP